MDKKICSICSKEVNWFSGYARISDGYICSKCWGKAEVPFQGTTDILEIYNVDSIIWRIKNVSYIHEMKDRFKANLKMGSYVEFDDKNQMFRIGKNIYDYTSLIDCQLIEEGYWLKKGSVGGAVIGDALTGGKTTGALLGSITFGQQVYVYTKLSIKLILTNAVQSVQYIDFIKTKTEVTSFLGRRIIADAEQCINIFDSFITEKNL